MNAVNYVKFTYSRVNNDVFATMQALDTAVYNLTAGTTGITLAGVFDPDYRPDQTWWVGPFQYYDNGVEKYGKVRVQQNGDVILCPLGNAASYVHDIQYLASTSIHFNLDSS